VCRVAEALASPAITHEIAQAASTDAATSFR
jgi:hypothetical protein